MTSSAQQQEEVPHPSRGHYLKANPRKVTLAGVWRQVILSIMVESLEISFRWSVSGWCLGSLSLWVFLQQGIALGKTTETQASFELVMPGSYRNRYILTFLKNLSFSFILFLSGVSCFPR